MREIGKSKIEYPDTYIVVDVETTGLSPETERLIEVAAIKYINHKEVARFSELINPLRDQLPVDLLDKDKTICYEMTIVKRKYHISLGISLIFVLFCFF